MRPSSFAHLRRSCGFAGTKQQGIPFPEQYLSSPGEMRQCGSSITFLNLGVLQDTDRRADSAELHKISCLKRAWFRVRVLKMLGAKALTCLEVGHYKCQTWCSSVGSSCPQCLQSA